jgi:hypothetical protein
MRWTLISLIAVFCLGAAFSVSYPYRALTPGTLRNGHLAQKDDCFSCHAILAGAPPAKCVACHKSGDIGLRSVKGAPLGKPNPRTQLIHRAIEGECFRCHFEHGGRFRPDAAGRFSHNLLPKQVASACSECHSRQKPADTIHTVGRFECSQCHRTQGWKPATYDHDRWFLLDRNHPPRCADCHAPGMNLKEYTCTNCHEHSLEKMERKHRKEGIANLAKCRRCHPSANEDDATIDGRPRQKREGREERE